MTCSAALQLKTRLRLDDSLDVLPVHGVAGHLEQLGIQASAALFTILWVGVGTYGVLIMIRQLLPLRVTSTEEQQGLDISAHGEEAYNTEFTG